MPSWKAEEKPIRKALRDVTLHGMLESIANDSWSQSHRVRYVPGFAYYELKRSGNAMIKRLLDLELIEIEYIGEFHAGGVVPFKGPMFACNILDAGYHWLTEKAPYVEAVLNEIRGTSWIGAEPGSIR